MWIRKDGAFEGIVPLETFFTAQQILIARASRYTDEELLDKLRQIYQDKGRLSSGIINLSPDIPRATTYIRRFGSLSKAYELVGFHPPRDLQNLEINRRLRRLHPEIVERTQHTIAELGGQVWCDRETDLLHLNQELVVCLVLARCQILPSGLQRWRVCFDPVKYSPDITLAIRLDPINQAELDYYLLPRLNFGLNRLHFTTENLAELECFRFETLEFFYGLSRRADIRSGLRIVHRF